MNLALILALLLAIVILVYVILDGFDLGIGILFPFTHSEQERDHLMNSVAPIWDGNETWLVFGGAMLYGAFPKVYGLLLPILYMPIMLMLIALIFRGVSFEFRFKAEQSKAIWNWIFAISSLAATFFQGVILGTFIQGFPVNPAMHTLNSPYWMTPFSFMSGIALVCGYALLGSTWLLFKSSGALQKRMIGYSKGLLFLLGFFLILVSIWTPLHSPRIFERWFLFPNMLYLIPFPLITAYALYAIWVNLNFKHIKHESRPFIYTILVFICSYLGISISIFPYMVPYQLTFSQAAAPDSTLSFILIGEAIALPILLVYTGYAYYVFRGKSFAGYH